MRTRFRFFVPLFLVASLAGCSSDSASGTGTSFSPTPEPTWCLSVSAIEGHRIEATDLEALTGDPRSDDPSWIYLEALTDAVWLTGPDVAVEGVDLESVRAFQRIGLDRLDGTVAVVRAGDGLEYRISASHREGYVLEVALIDAELCLVGEVVTSKFLLVASEVPGIVHELIIEVFVDDEAVGRTEPLTVQVGPA